MGSYCKLYAGSLDLVQYKLRIKTEYVILKKTLRYHVETKDKTKAIERGIFVCWISQIHAICDLAFHLGCVARLDQGRLRCLVDYSWRSFLCGFVSFCTTSLRYEADYIHFMLGSFA